MSNQERLRRPLIYLLIISVIFGAALGIIAVLRNSWGWYEVRVITSTVILAVASLAGLACDLSRTSRGQNLLPKAGLVLTLISAVTLMLGLWTNMNSEIFWLTTSVLTVFAVATVHICLLSIAKLPAKFAWVYWIACQVIYGLAALIAFVIIGEPDGEIMARLIAVGSIVATALSLTIPLLHRLSRENHPKAELLTSLEERNVDAIDQEIQKLQTRIETLQKLRHEIQQNEPAQR